MRIGRLAALLSTLAAGVAWSQESVELFEETQIDSEGELVVTAVDGAIDKLVALPTVHIADFPWSPKTELILELAQTSPLAEEAMLTLSGEDLRPLESPPELSFFTGHVALEPESTVLLIVSADGIRGFVARGPDTVRFRSGGPKGSGARAYALTSRLPSGPLNEDVSACPVRSQDAVARGSVAMRRSGALIVPIALEVTPEVADAFASYEELIEYVISLVAVASIPFEREAVDEGLGSGGVSLRLAHLNIMLGSENRLCDGMIVGETACSGSGEFCFRDENCAEDETCDSPGFVRRAQCFRDHWFANFPDERFPRALAMQLWRAPAEGAGGYCLHLSTLCSDEHSYAWAIIRSDPERSFLPRFPEDTFFASTMTHEIAHLFGAVHAECLDPPPPLEVCRNDDTGGPACWRGATADTPGGATVMSTFGCSDVASPLTFVPQGRVNVPGDGPNPFPDTRMAEIVRTRAEAATECVSECPGPDTDADSINDDCDLDSDNDGVLDEIDPDPFDPDACGDSDGDSCDDCAFGTDGFGPDNDRLPEDDGADSDCDGVCDAADPSLPCIGDCNRDCDVHVDEVVTVTAIALGMRPIGDCSAADENGDARVTVDECVRSVGIAMHGCPS